MPTYLYFLLWAAFFFVMMRFGCGAHIMGHGHGHRRDGDAPDDASPSVDLNSPSSVDRNNDHRH